MRALLLALALALGAIIAAPAGAVEPDEILDDPVLEARARALSQEIRCLVCQNEPIDSSGADLARDLRILVRERLVADCDLPSIAQELRVVARTRELDGVRVRYITDDSSDPGLVVETPNLEEGYLCLLHVLHDW